VSRYVRLSLIELAGIFHRQNLFLFLVNGVNCESVVSLPTILWELLLSAVVGGQELLSHEKTRTPYYVFFQDDIHLNFNSCKNLLHYCSRRYLDAGSHHCLSKILPIGSQVFLRVNVHHIPIEP
jgi:hypothetical protein